MAIYSLIDNNKKIHHLRAVTQSPEGLPTLFPGVRNQDSDKMQVNWDAMATNLDGRFDATTNNPWEHGNQNP